MGLVYPKPSACLRQALLLHSLPLQPRGGPWPPPFTGPSSQRPLHL